MSSSLKDALLLERREPPTTEERYASINKKALEMVSHRMLHQRQVVLNMARSLQMLAAAIMEISTNNRGWAVVVGAWCVLLLNCCPRLLLTSLKGELNSEGSLTRLTR